MALRSQDQRADSPLFSRGDLRSARLQPGECKNDSATDNPSALTVVNGNPSGSAGDRVYQDTASVTGTRRLAGSGPANKVNTASATCPLCPPHQ